MIETFEPYKYIIGIALLAVGLTIAFVGKWVFEFIVALAGCILGSIVGVGVGLKYNGILLAFIFGAIGAIIGGLVFHYLVKFGMALACGLFAFILIYINFDTVFVILVTAIIIGICVFAVCLYFIDRIIIGVTSLIGGIICIYAMLLFVPPPLALFIGTVIFVFGVGVQIYIEKGGVSEK